jgi:hypothetical protein
VNDGQVGGGVGWTLVADFAGQTIPITDPATGETWGAQLFVAGGSSHAVRQEPGAA